MKLSSTTLGQLQRVFGARVPAEHDAALDMLEHSPLSPADPAARAALRQAIVEAAGRDLDDLAAAAAQLAPSRPVGPGQRPLTGPLAIQLGAATITTAPTDPAALAPTVSLTRARALFAELAGAPDIPHDFVDEGCHFRAHVECKRLEEAGVYSEKAFCVPDGGDLKILSDKSPLGFTLGMFHTAPVIHVRGDDGRVRRMVLDPSLFDAPVDVETWQSRMSGLNQKPTSVLYLPRFAAHLTDRDDPPTAWRPADLEEALAWNTQYREVQAAMKEMGFYDHLKELAGEAEASS